jgi:ankyrin repeat protein
MRTSRTRHRLQAAAAVLGTVAAVYGISRLIAPTSAPRAERPTAREQPPAPPIVPRVDPDPVVTSRPKVSPAFHQAVADGDLEAAKRLYVDGADLAETLGPAAKTGKRDLVAWLLDQGADVHDDETQGEAPILEADAHPEVVKLLLERGAKEPTLVMAATMGKPNAVNRVLAKGANVSDGTPSPLGAAIDGASRGAVRRAIVDRLLAAGADPNHDTSPTPLHAALGQCSELDSQDDLCDLHVVRALVTKGAQVESSDILLAANARSKVRDVLVDTVLAGRVAKAEIVEALSSVELPADAKLVRKLGAIAGFRHVDGTTETLPLFEAIEGGSAERVNAMLEGGAPATQVAQDGRTALLAALEGSADVDEKLVMVRALVARGADPNRTELGGDMPLVKAVNTGDVRIVAALLDRGARINYGLLDREGSSTALEIAEASGNQKIARVLLQRGARRRPVPPPSYD